MRGFVIAAPNSGAGKTAITLGLLRAFREAGVHVASGKSGPDYIDPQFHAAASGAACVNLDAWAMSPTQLRGLASGQTGDLLIVEGAMGLFDGAQSDHPMGKGSVADLAGILDLPIVLVLDVSRQSQTAAAVVQGLANWRPDVKIAGVILNRVGSPRHADGIARAMQSIGMPVLGAIPRATSLQTPSRHLGLVQATEHPDLEFFLDQAAKMVAGAVDLSTLADLAKPVQDMPVPAGLAPLGQRIAIARDRAFAFAYPHLLDDWQRSGAELSFFSPLENAGPEDCNAVFLPGGYPELYAEQLANNHDFIRQMHIARDASALIYGECGGYMTLGESLTDAKGKAHQMLGMLPVQTSFENPRLHLGYRRLLPAAGMPWAGPLLGHEFHYASVIGGEGSPLFSARDSLENTLRDMGRVQGRVMGSFAHVIAAA